MNKKVLLFSVTADDCKWQTFRAGGKGGQHQNKTETGVRCIHEPSGAVGEARDNRSQHTNKQSAFSRMTDTKEFKIWHKAETARRMMNYASIDEMIECAVNEQMLPKNILVEIKDNNNRWVNAEDISD